MVKVDQIEYIVEQIRSRISAINSEYFKHVMNEENNPDYYSNGEREVWFAETINRIYLLILSYFEMKGLIHYHQVFKDRYNDKMGMQEFLLESRIAPFDELMHSELVRISEFEDFLLPFSEFNVMRENKRLSTNMLESILKNTNLIIKKTNTKVTNETSVYNSVKWFVEILWPRAIISKAKLFPGKFQHYNADLLIPEISTAVEYKFLKEGDSKNPEVYINELKIDSLAYQGNEEFNLFYAVLYTQGNKEYKHDTIMACWDSKNFPANWRFLIVSD